MGSAQSYLPQETATALTVVVVMGAIGLACRTQGISPGDSNASIDVSAMPMVKNRKKKKKLGDTTHKLRVVDEAEPMQTSKPQNIAVPDVIPGQFDVKPMKELIEDRPPASKKSNRKKASNLEETSKTNSSHSNAFLESPVQTARNRRPSQKRQPSNTSPLTITPQSSELLHVSTTSIDTDGSWTRVGSRRDEHGPRNMDHSLGDIKITTSQTDTSSFASHTEDEAHDSFLLQQHTPSSTKRDSDLTNKKTLAEKLLPKPKKSKVDDMLENSAYPPLSRVIRVAPSSNEDPLMDFSLADYEDVPDAGGNDADGEDDGWGVVTSKRPRRAGNTAGHTALPPSSQASKASEPLTKRQRQNVQKRERQKVEKAEAEGQRLATLEKHKRGLEKVRMTEQFSKSGSSVSGGMKATVDERGKLVWE